MRTARVLGIAGTIVALTALVSGCVSDGTKPDTSAAPSTTNGISSGNLHAASYTPNGTSLDVLNESQVIELNGGCLGVNMGQDMILALPEGSSIDSDGQITVNVTGSQPMTFNVGDTIHFTGTQSDTTSSDFGQALALPKECPDSIPVWFLLPKNTPQALILP